MLGLNRNGNDWRYAAANFFIVFGSQLVYEAYELLALNRLPTAFECYRILLSSAVSTLIIYGINKAKKETKK